jgi:hypothetical protein
MVNPICSKLERAISQVVTDFQTYTTRFWEERDIHWSLFYYLKTLGIEEAYPSQLIRAEFPTRRTFGKRPARGHYDLTILNLASYSLPEVQRMKPQTLWQEYLDLVRIDAAIEIKLWQNRLNDDDMMERINWDVQKLTEELNNVDNAYFLNFVQMDFNSKYDLYKDYYIRLRENLKSEKKLPNLKILCVPSENRIQPDPAENWL